MVDEYTSVHVRNSKFVTGQRYQDEVLKSYVRLFGDAYAYDFLFINDNTLAHRAKLVNELL